MKKRDVCRIYVYYVIKMYQYKYERLSRGVNVSNSNKIPAYGLQI